MYPLAVIEHETKGFTDYDLFSYYLKLRSQGVFSTKEVNLGNFCKSRNATCFQMPSGDLFYRLTEFNDTWQLEVLNLHTFVFEPVAPAAANKSYLEVLTLLLASSLRIVDLVHMANFAMQVDLVSRLYFLDKGNVYKAEELKITTTKLVLITTKGTFDLDTVTLLDINTAPKGLGTLISNTWFLNPIPYN